MTPYELFDIALSVGNRIDVQWGLFITVHLALLGGIVYVDRPLRFAERVGAALIYFPFAFLNYRIMNLQSDLLKNSYQEIASRGSDPCCIDSNLVRFVADDLASGRFQFAELFLVGGHLLMGLLVGASIALGRPTESRSHTGSSH